MDHPTPSDTSGTRIHVVVAVDDPRWTDLIASPAEFAQGLCTAVTHRVSLPEGSFEVSVALTNDPVIKTFNTQYRNTPSATNVLAFPQHDALPAYTHDVCLLGDVVLAFETVQREAQEQNKTFAHHMAHLIVHGLLHLLGYDHESDDQANVMESLETYILESINIPDPYAGQVP